MGLLAGLPWKVRKHIYSQELSSNNLLTGLLLAELSESEELPLLDEEDEDPDEEEEDDEPEDPEVLPLNLGFGGILINNLQNLSFNLQNSPSCGRFPFCSIIVPKPELWFGMFRNIINEQCRIYSQGRLSLVLWCLEVNVLV